MAVADVDGRSRGESLLVLAATVVLAALLIESSGFLAAAFHSLVLLAALPAIALSFCVLARRWNLHCLHMSACAIVFGSVGVLLGARLDFGQFGLTPIAEWCRVMQPVSLDGIRTQVAAAPWTYAGMLGGCNLGLLLSARFRVRGEPASPAGILRFVACNAGMILGMWLAEALRAGSDYAAGDVPAAARLLLAMVLGMAVGMSCGWWGAEWAIRGLRRRRWSAVSQRAWRSATGSA